MPRKFYLDSSIWRDYYENRSDNLCPLGEWALMLINNILETGDFILCSDFVFEELKIKYREEEIMNILEITDKRNLLLKLNISDAQAKEAAILCKQRKWLLAMHCMQF